MKRFLLADHFPIIRFALKTILERQFVELEIAEADNKVDLFAILSSGEFDLLIFDIAMPGENGMELLQELKVSYPKIPILILTSHPEQFYAVQALKSGAAGYLNKDMADKELVEAVSIILSGKRYVPASVAEKLAIAVQRDATKQPHLSLASRELEVMKLLARGLSLTETAQRLSLGVTTVSTYRARIMEKMNFRTNAELALYCIEYKLLSLSFALGLFWMALVN